MYTNNYDPYEIKMANEIAQTLNDRESLALHLQYVRKYKEEYLRSTLTKVMAIPEQKIRRSRAALFTFLISQAENNGNVGN